MKTNRSKNIILGMGAVLGMMLLPSLQASEFDKKTIITFPEPMQIPGMVLPAGEYVVKRADGSLPNVIQFTNPEESEVFATVQAIPTIRQKPLDEVEIVTEERPSGSPEALKKWFYPGDLTGAEFVYPNSEANLLASARTPRIVESEPNATSPVSHPPEELTTSSASPEPVAEPGWEQAEGEVQAEEPVEIAQATPGPGATQAQPAQQAPFGQAAEAPAEEELPQTATSLTLASLLGGLAVFGGAALRRLSRQLG